MSSAANVSSAVARLTMTRGMQPSLVRSVVRPGAILRRPLTAGPMAFLLLLAALASALLRTVLAKMSSDVRACRCCCGFGIARCKLCEGRGVVGWEGKWSHFEPCPLCLGRRFTRCETCGGMFHKPIFRHCTVLVTPETFGQMAPRVRAPPSGRSSSAGSVREGAGSVERPRNAGPSNLPLDRLARGLLRADASLPGQDILPPQPPGRQPFKFVYMDD